MCPCSFFTSFVERFWWSSGNGIDGQGVIARCQGIEETKSLRALSLNGFSKQAFWEAYEGFTGLFSQTKLEMMGLLQFVQCLKRIQACRHDT